VYIARVSWRQFRPWGSVDEEVAINYWVLVVKSFNEKKSWLCIQIHFKHEFFSRKTLGVGYERDFCDFIVRY
jgi:hypothetical protein